MIVSTRRAERWLLEHGFVELPGNGSGHRQFKNEHTGHKIMVRGHGRPELDPWAVGNFMKAVRTAGFDPRDVRRDLGT